MLADTSTWWMMYTNSLLSHLAPLLSPNPTCHHVPGARDLVTATVTLNHLGIILYSLLSNWPSLDSESVVCPRLAMFTAEPGSCARSPGFGSGVHFGVIPISVPRRGRDTHRLQTCQQIERLVGQKVLWIKNQCVFILDLRTEMEGTHLISNCNWFHNCGQQL